MGNRLTPAQKRARTIARNKKIRAKAKRDALRSVEESLTKEQRDKLKYVVDCAGRAIRKHCANVMRLGIPTLLVRTGVHVDNLRHGLDKLDPALGANTKVKHIYDSMPNEVYCLLSKTLNSIYGGGVPGKDYGATNVLMKDLTDDFIANIKKECTAKCMMAGFPTAAPKKRKPSVKRTRVEANAMAAKAKHEHWQRRLVLAQKKVKEYERKVKYYNKKEEAK